MVDRVRSYFEFKPLALRLAWMAAAIMVWLLLVTLFWGRIDIIMTAMISVTGGLVGKLVATLITRKHKPAVSQRGIVTDADLVGGVDYGKRHPDDLYVDSGKPVFGVHALAWASAGWCVLPQGLDDRLTLPEIAGKKIRAAAYMGERPDIETVKLWAGKHPTANLAIMLGWSSGYVYAVDLDIVDLQVMKETFEVVERVLGHTSFKMLSSPSRVTLLYRAMSPGAMPENRSIRIPGRGRCTIEVLGQGKVITALGYHHKSGAPFAWSEQADFLQGPSSVPLVEKVNINTLVDVFEIRNF